MFFENMLKILHYLMWMTDKKNEYLEAFTDVCKFIT